MYILKVCLKNIFGLTIFASIFIFFEVFAIDNGLTDTSYRITPAGRPMSGSSQSTLTPNRLEQGNQRPAETLRNNTLRNIPLPPKESAAPTTSPSNVREPKPMTKQEYRAYLRQMIEMDERMIRIKGLDREKLEPASYEKTEVYKKYLEEKKKEYEAYKKLSPAERQKRDEADAKRLYEEQLEAEKRIWEKDAPVPPPPRPLGHYIP